MGDRHQVVKMITKVLALLAIGSLVLGGCSHADEQPVSDAFPTAREVRLFVETGQTPRGMPIFTKASGLLLNNAQRDKFEDLLYVHEISPDEEFTACFIPHHFFRYYDNTGKQIGEISVCFCCSGVSVSGPSNVRLTDDNDLRANYPALERFVASLGEPIDVGCD